MDRDKYIRLVKTLVTDPLWKRQMKFIAGPRQSCKTTLAKSILAAHKSSSLYYNWDIKEIRERYRLDSNFFYDEVLETHVKTPWICFDEIHKVSRWKDILKNIFDANENKLNLIVTGSARLDLFRRSGDSLKGRYVLFHLFPLTLAELNANKHYTDLSENQCALDWLEEKFSCRSSKESKQNMDLLLQFSGFPEPLSKASKPFHRTWQKKYKEQTVYEELNDLSQIKDLDKVAHLLEILPSRVASPMSVNSLREELELSFDTVKNYLKYLELSYTVFYIKPFTKNISRSIKKEPKLYFYDWTTIIDQGAKFENYIACELQTLIHYWNDAGLADADLFYIRTKDAKETDFLITMDSKPWLLIEVKLSKDKIAGHHFKQAEELGSVPILQLNYEGDEIIKVNQTSFICPAYRFLG